MEDKKFNPYDWIPNQKDLIKTLPARPNNNISGVQNDIEVIIQRIEGYQLDLTANYHDWLSIGFSFADELGEIGREYFHRISKFHPKYNFQECNRQFDKCLNRQQRGVSIKTFFYLAQSAGVNINCQ